MYCSKCGKEINIEWKACPYCGNELKVPFHDNCVKSNDSDNEKKEEPLSEEIKEQNLGKDEREEIVFKLSARRRVSRSVQILSSEIRILQEHVKVHSVGVRKIKDLEFEKGDVSKIKFGVSPEWVLWDYIGIAFSIIIAICMCLAKPCAWAVLEGIILLMLYLKFACVQHLIFVLKDNKEIKIPINQKADVLEILKEFNYPDEEIEKIKKKELSQGSLRALKWISTFILLILGAFVFELYNSVETNTDNVISESTSTSEEEIDLSSIDMEIVIGKSVEDIEKLGFVQDEEDEKHYYNGDVCIEVDDMDIVDYFLIEGDTEEAPTFRNVELDMGFEEAMEALSGEYDVYDKSEDSYMAVGYENKEAVAITQENDKVISIGYMKITDEQIEEIQASINAEYVFPDSDKKYLSEDEVRSVTADQLFIGRNEIFARHGRIFDMPELAEYFSQKSWYEGTIPADQFDENVLNDFEKKNVELIQRIEDEVNGNTEQQNAIDNTYDFLVGHLFHLKDSQPQMEFISSDTVVYLWGGEMQDEYLNYSISARYEVYKDNQKEWLTFIIIDGEEYQIRCFEGGTIDLASTTGYGRFDGWYEMIQ